MAKRKLSFFKITIVLLITVFLLVGSACGYFFYSIFSIDELPEADIALTTKFYDNNDELLTTMYQENRFEVSLEEIPVDMRQAMIAVEDSHFYDHYGVNLLSMGRAFIRNIQSGRIVEGGSTITQQLAKNLFLTHDRTFQRKLDELAITLHLERYYTKDEILNKYLNTIYFGHGSYGVEAASQRYFDKPVSELTLAESAFIAGLARGPGYYSPFIEGNEQAYKVRQEHVLRRMVELDYISKAEKEAALDKKLIFSPGQESNDRPAAYFLDYAINLITGSSGPTIYQKELSSLDLEPEDISRGGLNIHTTLDPSLQKAGENALQEGLAAFPARYQDEQGVTQPQGALVAMDPNTGHVKAMVGGLDYKETNLNRANSRRSPGSAFKPFLYAAALDSHYTAASQIKCEPVSIPMPGSTDSYEPTDFGGDFHHRSLTLREALVNSCNVCAVKINADLGPEKLKSYSKNMGINSLLRPVPSLALGTSEVTPLEMTAAFTPLANRGNKTEPVFITKITDARGRVLWEKESSHQHHVLDEKVAFLLTDILKEVLSPEGTGWQVDEIIDFPAAGKTGTSSAYRDVYMVGYTPDLVASVYIGDDHQKSLQTTGGITAAPIWANFMEEALRDQPRQNFYRPEEGLVELTLCAETGLNQSPECTGESYLEIFIQGTEPEKECSEEDCPHIDTEEPGWWPPFDFPWFR